MTSAEEYRRLAAECLAVAQQITNPDDKAAMLEIAEACRRLAEWAAAKDRNAKDPG
jgi:hypothetical protein